jgi:cysteine-rich repeat protein
MHQINVGHGNRSHRTACALGVVAMIIAAAMSGSCFFGTATNLCGQPGRRCSPGQACAASQDICIDIGGCGDGIISPDKGEVCDDGNVIDGDGCSADCTSDETCGNGMKDAKETCDDGNRTSGDGCSADCVEEKCGDSIYNPENHEECDTGTDTQACDGHGRCVIPRCGDGYTNKLFIPFMATAPEECDEAKPDPADPTKTVSVDTTDCNGNNDGFNGPGSCRHASCGDGYLNPMFKPNGTTPEACDTGGDSPTCNGNIDLVLKSDGTSIQSNNKDSKCQAPTCGDGYLNPRFIPNGPNGTSFEACDAGQDTSTCNGNHARVLATDGTLIQPNDLNSECQLPRCGDGYLNPMFKPNGPDGRNHEACDAGADTSECNGNHDSVLKRDGTVLQTNDVDSECQHPSCGDGYLNPMSIPIEQCDNGDQAHGNGNSDTRPGACRSNCLQAFCGDGVKDAGEVCDPGTGVTPPKPEVGCSGQGSCQNNCMACGP